MTKLNKLSLLSNREREYLEGVHDKMYYQYQANLRARIQTKVESLMEDLPLLLGNKRLDGAKAKFDWSPLLKAVEDFEHKSP